MKTVKVFFGLAEAELLVQALMRNEEGLHDTHEAYDQNGNKIMVEIHTQMG